MVLFSEQFSVISVWVVASQWCLIKLYLGRLWQWSLVSLLLMTGKGITNPWHKLYVLQPLTSFDPAAFLVENCSADINCFLDFFHTLCNNNPVIACQMSCKISLCHFIALHWTDLSKSAINLKGVGYGSYHIPVLSAPQLWKGHESTWKDLWLSWNLNSALEFLPYKDIRPLFKSAVFHL